MSAYFFSFVLRVLNRRWWSDVKYVSRFTRVSRRLLLHFLRMFMWSIWFSVFPSGETHVALLIVSCGKTLPSITKLLNVQKSANSFSFMVSNPCLPIMSSLPVLSEPTFAFGSPIRIFCISLVFYLAHFAVYYVILLLFHRCHCLLGHRNGSP